MNPVSERDCNTCASYVQGRGLSECPSSCWDCVGSSSTNLPSWTPIKEDKKMSDGMTEMSRERRITQDGVGLNGKGIAFDKPQTALDIQVGGGHYKEFAIQPIEFCMANGFNACQTKVIKYVSRKKGDLPKMLEDLDKAIHVIQLYKQLLQAGKSAPVNPV